LTWRRIASDPDGAGIRDACKTFTNCCRSVGGNVNRDAGGVEQCHCIRAAIVEDVGLQFDNQQTVWRNDCAGWNDGLWSARRIIVDPPTAHVERRVAAVDNLDPFRSAFRRGHEFVDQHSRRVGSVCRTGNEHPQHNQERQDQDRPAHNPSGCKHRTLRRWCHGCAVHKRWTIVPLGSGCLECRQQYGDPLAAPNLSA
jgi:hypothetical protein